MALAVTALLMTSGPVFPETPSESVTYWPQWRGPTGNGVSPDADPPTSWSETENVAWKVEIPGKGSASPIVWADVVYVLTAVPVGNAEGAGNFGSETAVPQQFP